MADLKRFYVAPTREIAQTEPDTALMREMEQKIPENSEVPEVQPGQSFDLFQVSGSHSPSDLHDEHHRRI